MTKATTSDIRLRMTQSQKEQLKNMALASGYKTISEFCRCKIFDSDLATHTKLNQILNLLSQEHKAKSDGVKKHENKSM